MATWAACMAMWVGCWAAAAEGPKAEKPFAWPQPVFYNGIERDAAWLEAAWAKHGPKMVKAGGKYFHLDDPRDDEPGPKHVQARVTVIRPDGVLECIRDGAPPIGVQPVAFKVKIGDWILARYEMESEGSFGRGASHRLMRCYAWHGVDVEARGLTRLQFAEALRSGVALYVAGACGMCKGTGMGTSPLGRPMKCRACGATGKAAARWGG